MFANESECVANCTVNVYAVPCVEIGKGWVCACLEPGNWESLCRGDIYNDYYALSLTYIIVGLLLTIPGTILFLLDLGIQFKREPKINVIFIAKFVSILFGICRIAHYCEIANTLHIGHYHPPDAIIKVSSIFYWIPDVLGIVVYFMITIMWLNLLLTLKNMSSEETNHYRIARNVYLISSVIYIIGGIILACLLGLVKMVFYLIYAAWIGIPLVITVLYCCINIVKLSYELESVEKSLRETMRRKNWNLGMISLVLLCCFIELVVFQIYFFITFSPLSYHVFSLVLRLLELVAFYLYLVFLQKHLLTLFGLEEPKSTTATRSKSKSQPGTQSNLPEEEKLSTM
eukprot:TRINITY_DN16287_c0_g1_i1.p1 TRINITY_DN16287_c0_g1~~TRINITY_DN16287_c0_g1_i1.p1  ORF type:complete len:353 (-),score=65.23 TRINITY_DN16287_c0_g1_i1:14-1045(-)